jgi:hypothetical protein
MNSFENCVLGKKQQKNEELHDLYPVIHAVFFMAQDLVVGQGLLIIEASQTHSDTSRSVRLLWTNDQPDAESSV